MTRSELVLQLAERANLPQRVARIIVDAIFDGMKESLVRGERIEIRGFGSFRVRVLELEGSSLLLTLAQYGSEVFAPSLTVFDPWECLFSFSESPCQTNCICSSETIRLCQ